MNVWILYLGLLYKFYAIKFLTHEKCGMLHLVSEQFVLRMTLGYWVYCVSSMCRYLNLVLRNR